MNNLTMQTYQKLLKQTGNVSRENLFIILGSVQDALGCVPAEVICDLASRTGLSKTQIYGALTSYRDFKIRSQGEDSRCKRQKS